MVVVDIHYTSHYHVLAVALPPVVTQDIVTPKRLPQTFTEVKQTNMEVCMK